VNKKIRQIFFLCLLFAATLSFAQTYNFRLYTEDEGLPQSYIYCISQTSKGFLYLSTGDGFAVFDGNKFTASTTKDNLAENFINTHYTDSRGITWIGHFQKGISYKQGRKFYKLKGSDSLETKVNSFAEDKKKNIWFGALQKGLFKIDSALSLNRIETGVEANFNSICFDSEGELLAATSEGLFLFKANDTQKLGAFCPVVGLESKNVKCIIPTDSTKTTFWVAVPGDGVFKIMRVGNCYQVSTKISSALNSNGLNISTIFIEKSGNLWVSLFGEGLRKVSFHDKNSNGSFYISQINKQNGLSSEYIQSIFEDFEGDMWFGSLGGGLIEMPMNKFNYYSSKHVSEQDNIKAILVDNKTRALWIGSDKGLGLFDLQHSKENIQYNASNGFVNDQVNALMQDSAGKIWIGTAENGVFILDPETKKFENFSAKNKLQAKSINSIEKTISGTIWIGTTDGAYMYEPQTFKIAQYTTIDGLLHNNVQHIYSDRQKRVWFSSHGAVPYYRKNGEFTYLKDIPNMKIFYVNSVTQDNSGTMWIATEGDGVYSYNNGNYINYRVDADSMKNTIDGLLSNFCYFVIVDKDNTVWVGHKNGLSKKKFWEKKFIRFTKSDGLIFPENNLNADFRDTKGNVWFGTTSGIVNFDCESNKMNTHEPRTSIIDIVLTNQSGSKMFTADEEIFLPYDHYTVKLDFIGISMVDASKVMYKYRLLGLDTLWRSTFTRTMEFPKIGEGIYTFQLIACNNDGVWNKVPIEIKFEINAPFWKKTWFYVLTPLLFLGLGYFIISWRTRSLLRARELLKRLVEEKTVLLKKEKEVVEAVKLQLEEKNKDITDSINYAKRIQEAILPSQAAIYKNFPEAFIYYKPKDIVSGDFYWFTEAEGYYFVAAVDCTGHGVPGAFMSLIASTLLNDIVNEKKITGPAEILQKLNNQIIEALKQSEEDSSSRDGMDMAICRVDKQKSKLVFAGAARPLYHVRRQVLTEIKGQGYPIGGHYGLMNLKYSDSEIDLEKGDMFYISSDGYADQFHDTDKKKFSTKRLKALMEKISALDMEAQRNELNDAMINWKGDAEQIDDILIVGIRV
jgi:ligand-binding sensor domain-containing protein/serine phosphatase RsbU (regulator of sigma subunit)